MKNRTAVFAVVALLAVAVPALAAGETDATTARPNREGSVAPDDTDAKKPARQSAPATTDDNQAVDVSGSVPVVAPSINISPASSPDPEPATTWETALKPVQADGRRGGHGNRGGHGGWRPPTRPPHGRRGQWRRDRYGWFGSWHFLIFGGPRIYVPVRSPSVIRLPRNNGVYVRQTGDDALGRVFASSVRDRLREQGLKVVYTDADAAIELYLVSMDEDPEDPGWNSAVSVSYISNPGNRFITAQMIDVGDEQVDELAELVAEYVDDLADDYCR